MPPDKLSDAAIDFVNSNGAKYMDLVGHLFLSQAARNDRKKRLVRRYIELHMPEVRMNCDLVLAGDMAAMREYDALAGPVPAKE